MGVLVNEAGGIDRRHSDKDLFRVRQLAQVRDKRGNPGKIGIRLRLQQWQEILHLLPPQLTPHRQRDGLLQGRGLGQNGGFGCRRVVHPVPASRAAPARTSHVPPPVPANVMDQVRR